MNYQRSFVIAHAPLRPIYGALDPTHGPTMQGSVATMKP